MKSGVKRILIPVLILGGLIFLGILVSLCVTGQCPGNGFEPLIWGLVFFSCTLMGVLAYYLM